MHDGEGEAKFLAHWKLEPPYDWHWHGHDYAIGDYVYYCGADTKTSEVDTVTGLSLVPDEVDRCTLEGNTECYSKDPAGDESGYTPDGDPEIKVRIESSVIKYENGTFYRHHSEAVEQLKGEGAL